MLRDLRGVFALIVWDVREQTFLATRDPLGMHPLFHTSIAATPAFSWSLDALLRAGASREVNRVFVAEHLLRRWRSADETYFASIRRVPAGHCLVGHQPLRPQRYWSDHGDVDHADRAAWLDAFERRLDRAVARCLTLGRPGVYLSGGADSVNVAISAAALARRSGAPPPVALTVTFPDEGSNEDEMQERVAGALSMPRLRTPAVAPGERPLEATLLHAAERCAPVGVFWDQAYRTLGERAKEAGCEVLFDGEGGDEWLAPPLQRAAEFLRQLELRRLGRFLSADGRAGRQRLRGVSTRAWRYAVRPTLHQAVTAPLARRAPALHARYRRLRHPIPSWVSNDPALRAALSERIDASVDMSLAHPLVSMHLEDSYCLGRSLGIPVLHPLWDADLVRFLAAAPPEMLQLGGQPKGLAVESARRRLPELGPGWPRPATADAFFERILAEAPTVNSALPGAGGLFERLGILEPDAVEPRIEKQRAGNALSSRDLLAIFTAEAWLRRRLED